MKGVWLLPVPHFWLLPVCHFEKAVSACAFNPCCMRMLLDACCLCMLLVQADEAGASSVVDGRDDSLVQADAASAGMVKVRVLFSSFDQFHVNACACRYISCSTPLVLLLYSLRAHVCVHTVHPAVALRPCADFESMTHEHAS